jgi:hypothetical protein
MVGYRVGDRRNLFGPEGRILQLTHIQGRIGRKSVTGRVILSNQEGSIWEDVAMVHSTALLPMERATDIWNRQHGFIPRKPEDSKSECVTDSETAHRTDQISNNIFLGLSLDHGL